MVWTLFWDMHSGGGSKEDFDKIYIEAPQDEAVTIFYNRFGHNPHRVSCTCCGEDYSVSESETLAQASGYHRRCAYEKGAGYVEGGPGEYGEPYVSLPDYIAAGGTDGWGGSATFIFEKDILPEEREGDVPEEGYVWQ